MQVKTTHAGRLFRVEVLSWTDEDGRVVSREVVRHPGAVLIVPVLDDSRLVMIRNRRIAVGEWLWEFPAGTLEAGEDPQQAASRELEEETGYRAASWQGLGEFFTSPGIADERIRAYLARDLTPGEPRPDPGESIEIRVIDRVEVQQMVRDGRLCDGKTIAALHLLEAWESEASA
ncbi:MAG: NUDIX hydrolase [Planctomycetota bacterium]